MEFRSPETFKPPNPQNPKPVFRGFRLWCSMRVMRVFGHVGSRLGEPPILNTEVSTSGATELLRAHIYKDLSPERKSHKQKPQTLCAMMRLQAAISRPPRAQSPPLNPSTLNPKPYILNPKTPNSIRPGKRFSRHFFLAFMESLVCLGFRVWGLGFRV